MLMLRSVMCAVLGHRLALATVVTEEWKSVSRRSITFFGVVGSDEFVEVSVHSSSGEDRLSVSPGMLLSAANQITISHHAACHRCGKVNWQS